MSITISLQMSEKQQLLGIARAAIEFCFETVDNSEISQNEIILQKCIGPLIKKYSDVKIPLLAEDLSCFITLNTHASEESQLRGCIGTLEPRKGESLLQNIISNSILAAFYDSRFEPLRQEELNFIKIEISILSTPRAIHFKDKSELFEQIAGKGVILRSGYHRATFLPQVWDQLPQPENFLAHLSRKAGLFSNDYINASYEVYDVYAFEEDS